MSLLLRRGTDAERAGVVFSNGEIVYTTDTKSVYVGDGVTAGGNLVGSTTPIPVDSVDGRTGVVTLGDLYASINHTHTESEITDLDKYTQAEVDAAIAGTFSGDYDDLTNVPLEFAPIAHTHTKSEITDFSDGDYATSAQGTLADSALQSGNNVSLLTNDAGYITSGDIPGDAVISVDGRTGIVTLGDLYAPTAHTHTKSQITDFNDGDYATAAQGGLATSVLQSGDNISVLVNNAGYITLAEVPDSGIEEAPNDGKQYARQSLNWSEVSAGGAVSSVDGQTGDVNLSNVYLGKNSQASSAYESSRVSNENFDDMNNSYRFWIGSQDSFNMFVGEGGQMDGVIYIIREGF